MHVLEREDAKKKNRAISRILQVAGLRGTRRSRSLAAQVLFGSSQIRTQNELNLQASVYRTQLRANMERMGDIKAMAGLTTMPLPLGVVFTKTTGPS